MLYLKPSSQQFDPEQLAAVKRKGDVIKQQR